MSRSGVSGLQSALRAYESDKVKPRSEGQARIREIFSNRENLDIFQESASRDGGAGWIAFFQCLFQVVILEKRNTMRKSGGSAAERRLADAISLVRWIAERSVTLLSRKPFLSLVTHMTHLMILSTSIFPPAALDYAKALKTLLSYPPHLQNLDSQSWRHIMAICWAAVLGDEISVDDPWEGDEMDVDDTPDASGSRETPITATQTRPKQTVVSQATSEMVSLIPILLSTRVVDLSPPLPTPGIYVEEIGMGATMVSKIERFLSTHLNETQSHLPILRSLNVVVADLEINNRSETVAAGVRVLPHLINLWPCRNKAIREQVLIALRMLLPFLTHKTTMGVDSAGIVRTSLERLIEYQPKEAAMRGAFEPIDFASVRLRLTPSSGDIQADLKPFETRIMTAGFDFTHEQALRWAAAEMYSECCFQLYHTADPASMPTPSKRETQAKRRKLSDPLATLISNSTHGHSNTRLQAIQILIFVVDRHWSDIHTEAQANMRQTLLTLLDDKDLSIRMWTYTALAGIAIAIRHATHPLPSVLISGPALEAITPHTDDPGFNAIWSHAMRSLSSSASRAAAHAANALLTAGRIPLHAAAQDIQTLLHNIHIQGPIYPADSVCAFLDTAVTIIRQDVRFYPLNLEDQVQLWLLKMDIVAGSTGKFRLDPSSPADIFPLLLNICHIPVHLLAAPETIDLLPECPIVNSALALYETRALRNFNLWGDLPVDDSLDPTSQSQIVEKHTSADFLDNRCRSMFDFLRERGEAFLHHMAASQSGIERLALSTDYLRRALDFVVTALAFHAAVEHSGTRPDSTCLQTVLRVTESIAAIISSNTYDVPARYLIWQALEPLVHIRGNRSSASPWPMLLRPTFQSGIRPDLLPPHPQTLEEEHGTESQQSLLTTLWSDASIASSLKSFFDPALEIFGGQETTQMPSGTQYLQGPSLDEDDFGDIRIADSDAMPVSKEALECQRKTSSLLKLVSEFRLRGAALASGLNQATKDSAIVNAFLAAEGSRKIQLGLVLCDLIESDILRIGANAVDLVLSSFEEMISSYAYSRDEGLLVCALGLIAHAAPIWLAPEYSESDIGDRALAIARLCDRKVAQGTLISWRARLALLLFMDEYLDYDPDMAMWNSTANDSMDEDPMAPSDIISRALSDPDFRLRARAATSTAGLFYLSSIPHSQHQPFYHATVDQLPRELKHWDSFITDILWKLNCCITSPQLRAATVYHLYEIPPSTKIYDVHLHAGLSTVAKRLGLAGIASLYLAHAPIIISSQICSHQSPMRIAPRLYGFNTRKAYAAAALSAIGPVLLLHCAAERSSTNPDAIRYTGAEAIFASFCTAAELAAPEVTKTHLPAVIATAISDPFSCLFADPSAFSAEIALSSLSRLPGVASQEEVLALAKSMAEEVVARTAALVDCFATDEEVVHSLERRRSVGKAGSNVYNSIITHHIATAAAIPALSPSADLGFALAGIDFIGATVPEMQEAKVLLNTVIHLFSKINHSFLVNEQYRHLRNITLVLALYARHAVLPAISSVLIRETLPLLRMSGISQVALAMLRWTFEQVRRSGQSPSDLPELVVDLGAVRDGLPDSTQSDRDLCTAFEQWLSQVVPTWFKVDSMFSSLSRARTIWPPAMAALLKDMPEPTFERLCEDTIDNPSYNIMPIFDVMLKKLPTGKGRHDSLVAFQERVFWQIKDRLTAANAGTSASAFVDLLSACHGKVQPPRLEAVDQEEEASADPLEALKGKPRENPVFLLQAVIVTQIIQMTATNSVFDDRAAAFTALRHLASTISSKLRTQLSRPDLDLLDLLNPIPTPTSTTACPPFDILVTEDAWAKMIRDAQSWTTSLAIHLCTAMAQHDPFFLALMTLFGDISAYAKRLLPLLVHACLSIYDNAHKDILRIRHRTLSGHFSMALNDAAASIETTRATIDIMLHLRKYTPPYRSDELAHEAWLDVDPMLLSEAALRCESYSTALMFLESARSDKPDSRPVDPTNMKVQNIMYMAYSNVEDPDGFYGIQFDDVGVALERRLRHEGDYQRSLLHHSATLDVGANSSEIVKRTALSMVKDLHHVGSRTSANAFFNTVRSDTASIESEPLLYELAWKLGDWDLPVSTASRPSSEAVVYASLRAVHRERDFAIARQTVTSAIASEITRLSRCGSEKTSQIKKIVSDLICLREVQSWLSVEVQAALEARDSQSPELTRLSQLDSAFSFTDAERIMATRRSLIIAAKERESQNVLGDLTSPKLDALILLERACLLQFGSIARTEGKIQFALNAITAVRHLEAGAQPSAAARDEFAEVLWAEHEHSLAIQDTENRIKVLRGSKENVGSQLAALQSRQANWAAKAKLRAPREINALFENAIKLSKAHKTTVTEQSKLYHDYAVFADQQQAAIAKSPTLERLRGYISRNEAELRSSQPVPTTKRASKSSARSNMTDHLERNLQEDEAEITQLEADRSNFALTALKMYALSLALADEHDDIVTRMCSLWMEMDSSEDINKIFGIILDKVPSHKFIFLGPQLTARLDRPSKMTAFNSALNGLVLRMARQHPFHTLYQVLTLADGFKSPKSRRASDPGLEGRAPAAHEILAVLAADVASPVARNASQSMKKMADAAIKWSLARSEAEKNVSIGKNIPLPGDCPLKTLPINLGIPVATSVPAVDPLGEYKDVVTLVRYRSMYAVLGGIHRPKRMLVIDSRGVVSKELFKGEDELRQDAVMEQVFRMSNKLLERDKKTKARNLRFRTYTVVPLARKTGIMEFVGNSQAIGEWLKPAHVRYGKIAKDIPAEDFRRTLEKLQGRDPNYDGLVKKYVEMMGRFHPIMRHFFTEKHRDPMGWFTMRLNYTRSVAVTSMVGWVLGIGDRHCSNVLIDQKSGELVHIDFGIVFEDGSRLRIPERVPFRLTPDLVDGFGINGVEGTFRRCSEHTLRVLRESSEIIMTVLEVFKHDPLYDWDADPEKMQRAQGGGRVTTTTSASALEKADRILSKIEQKLGNDLNIEYTVNNLIQAARDPENLAKIFVGWQPWF